MINAACAVSCLVTSFALVTGDNSNRVVTDVETFKPSCFTNRHVAMAVRLVYDQVDAEEKPLLFIRNNNVELFAVGKDATRVVKLTPANKRVLQQGNLAQCVSKE